MVLIKLVLMRRTDHYLWHKDGWFSLFDQVLVGNLLIAIFESLLGQGWKFVICTTVHEEVYVCLSHVTHILSTRFAIVILAFWQSFCNVLLVLKCGFTRLARPCCLSCLLLKTWSSIIKGCGFRYIQQLLAHFIYHNHSSRSICLIFLLYLLLRLRSLFLQLLPGFSFLFFTPFALFSLGVFAQFVVVVPSAETVEKGITILPWFYLHHLPCNSIVSCPFAIILRTVIKQRLFIKIICPKRVSPIFQD